MLGLAAGVPHKFVPLSHVGAFAGVPYQILAIVVSGIGIWSLRSSSPIRAFGELLRKTISPHTVAGLFLFATLTVFMRVFTSIKSILPDLVPFFADQQLAGIEHPRTMLWKFHESGHAGLGSGISAFPSMHVANATLFVFLAAHMGNPVRVFAVLYGAVIMFASVHLGWHYAVDGYFSIAAIALIWLGVGRLISASSTQEGQRLVH